MRVLVIFGHPCEDSFGAAIYRTALLALEGHEVRAHDLYREGFQPVMTPEERENYLITTEPLLTRNARHIEDLRWCEALVVIYPTWMYGLPAMLKGWLDCVWLPGVTFEVAPAKGKRARVLFRPRLFVGITTSGSPWWWLRLIGDPGRRLWTRALFPPILTRTRKIWRQLYNMNHVTEADRAAFLARVEGTLRRL